MLYSSPFIKLVYANNLLPAAKEMLVAPAINPDTLASNSYVDFMAIDAPEAMDYLAVGTEIILKIINLFKKRLLNKIIRY